MNIRRIVRNSVNSIFRQLGYEVVRLGNSTPRLSYIPIRKTLNSAKRSGLSVGEFIDRTSNIPGATQMAIDQMEAFGLFDREYTSICEIGPGSGRYLEKIKQKYNSAYYEIYEIEIDWANWLVSTYHVTAKHCDGKSLSDTPSESIDFLHAHKVFTCIPLMASLQYFTEIARVVKKGGIILFDIMDEDCLDQTILSKWFQVGYYYPVMLSRQFTIDYFRRMEVQFLGSFYAPTGPGRSEYLIFSPV